ncbi:hypothetical protein U91I_02011 [alpha proteobacterium U9-1i]|nr:hypothetical protein U91I_02011 [alpha proteobacterium U9-1i]
MTRLVISALALSLLAGCGIKGGLERPGPMWNRDEATSEGCARQRAERERNPRVIIDARCEQPNPQ